MFPKPDRSNHQPRQSKTFEEPFIDIGWNEGHFSDGRPFRVECWAEDGITILTLFFSTAGLENMSNAQFKTLFEREGIMKFLSDGAHLQAAPMTDGSGNDMWSVSVVVGDDDDSYIEDRLGLRAYVY